MKSSAEAGARVSCWAECRCGWRSTVTTADTDTRLSAGDELALGAALSAVARATGCHVRIQRWAALARVSRVGFHSGPEAGAIVTFQGTTRDVSRLEYEAYREMAEERMAEILRGVPSIATVLAAAAAYHRIGSVPLGESSVIVSVSAPHPAIRPSRERGRRSTGSRPRPRSGNGR